MVFDRVHLTVTLWTNVIGRIKMGLNTSKLNRRMFFFKSLITLEVMFMMFMIHSCFDNKMIDGLVYNE